MFYWIFSYASMIFFLSLLSLPPSWPLASSSNLLCSRMRQTQITSSMLQYMLYAHGIHHAAWRHCSHSGNFRSKSSLLVDHYRWSYQNTDHMFARTFCCLSVTSQHCDRAMSMGWIGNGSDLTYPDFELFLTCPVLGAFCLLCLSEVEHDSSAMDPVSGMMVGRMQNRWWRWPLCIFLANSELITPSLNGSASTVDSRSIIK